MDLWLYVYGNGDFIYAILTSVNIFMNHTRGFFQYAALLSLLIFAVESTGIMPTRGYDWTKFFRVYLLISIFVITPYPGKIDIHDVITNKDITVDFENDKLPFGLIAPVAITSTIMYDLINLYQKNFEIDSSLNYSYSGMNFGANFIQSLDNANSYNASFNRNLDEYMQNCGFPLINKAGALAELRTSKDIFATLAKYTSANRFVQQQDFAKGTVTVETCTSAITDINNFYENNKDAILAANANRMGIKSDAVSYDRFQNSANASASTLLGISEGASASLKQAIGMNMLMDSIKSGAQKADNGNLALAAYDAEQFQQYKKTSELSGSATARTVPVLVGIAYALLFLLYPIMLFLAIAMGSYKAIGVFLQTVITINLIPLIYEILNYITTFYLQNKLGITITGQGYTYDVSTNLYSLTDNMIIAGNYLATSTPLIAYAIVTGSSFALTSVFGHINDPAKQQSSQVGQEYAYGNMNIGNTSMDTHSYNNVQGNKLDDQLSMNSGSPIMKETTPGGVNTNVGGQNYDINYKNELLAAPNFSQMATHSLENSLRHSQDKMSQLSSQWGAESRRAQDLSNRLSSGNNSTSAIGADDANNLKHAQDLASNIGADLSLGFKVAGSGGGVHADISSSISDGLDHSLSEYKKVSEELSHSSNKEISDAFSKSQSLTSSTSNTVQEAVSKSQALSDVQSNQSAINTNLSNDFGNYLRSNGYDPTQMNATEQTAMAQKFMESSFNTEHGIKNNLAAPADSLSNKGTTSHKVSSAGLQQPEQNATSNSVASHKAEVQAAIDNFNEHQGNVVGNQIKAQTKSTYHFFKDPVVNLANWVEGGDQDIKTDNKK